MTQLTKSDIPASLRGLDWIEASEENCRGYKKQPMLIFVNGKVVSCIMYDHTGEIQFLLRGCYACHNHHSLDQVDYFFPVI